MAIQAMDGSGEVVEGKVDWKGRPARRGIHGGFMPSLLVQVMYGMDNLSTIALAVNLVTYFNGVMHFGIAEASTVLTNFLGSSYILAVIVAYFADSFFGRHRAVLASACIEFMGLVLLTLQAHFPALKPPACNIFDASLDCKKVKGGDEALLFLSLYLIALGMAGVKAGLPSHGADQFDENDPLEAEQRSSFFNWLLLSSSIGAGISLTLIVWVQTKVGWDWGFGLSASGVFFGAVVFASGIPRYRIHPTGGPDPVVEIIQVFVVCIRNRKLRLPINPKDLYEIEHDKEAVTKLEFLPHRNMFRFMDKAAIRTTTPDVETADPQIMSSWRLCRVTQVENAKTILGIIPIFCSSIIMSTCLAQLQTFTIQQGLTMDTHLTKSFHIAPATLPVVPLVFMIVAIPIYDRLIVPSIRPYTGHTTGITHLQRIGIGLVLSSLSMATAAVVEVKRKNVAIRHGMIDAIPISQPLPISIFWLSCQYFVFGISDMFTYVGLIEFFYSEAPRSMKSMAISFLWCSIALGYFLSTILVEIVNHATKGITKSGGWLAGNNLNRNHLDLFYWLLAILTFLNFVNYLYWASRYKYKQQQPTKISQVDESP